MAKSSPEAPLSAYRLYPRKPTVKGGWYFTLICKGCGKNIYVLDDTKKGTSKITFSGDADILVPCPRCLSDEAYKASEFQIIQAPESIQGFRPPRVELSKKSRVPLLPLYKAHNPIMGVGLIEDRPEFAAIVGRIITAWSDIEVQCARLLAKIMGTNVPAAAAFFGSLRSSRAQSDAMGAVAKAVLNTRDEILFSAHLRRKAALESERNDLTHGCYGIMVSVPNSIVWVSQADYIAFTTSLEIDASAKALEVYRRKMFVYEIGTVERIAQEIAEFHSQLGFLIAYLTIDNEERQAQRYGELCNQPHIHAILNRIQKE